MAGYGVIKDDLDIVNQLGLVSQLRGVDASGLFECNSRSAIKTDKLHKSANDWGWFSWQHTATEKANKSYAWRILDNVNNDVFLGHVRFATQGEYSDSNAQPFQHGNLIATHNGTVKLHKYKDIEGKRSDSDMMIEDMSKTGVTKVLRDLNSSDAYALVIYDKAKKILSFVRNDLRPLYFAVNQERNVMYWASEPDILRLVLNRNKVRYTVDNSLSIFGLQEGQIFNVPIGNIRPKTNIFEQGDIIYTRHTEGNRVTRTYVLNEKPKPTIIVDNTVTTAIIREANELKTYSVNCEYCDKELSLYEQYKIKLRTKDDDYTGGCYWEHDDSFYCSSCVGGINTVAKQNVN